MIIAPLRVPVSSKKDFTLNLNIYRNAYFHTLNTAKKAYKDILAPQISKLPAYNRIEVRYTVFPKTKRMFDISNVLCIHDKFFLDALVELGKLPDDNYKHVSGSVYYFGLVDKENPRVEIVITELGEPNANNNNP